MSNVRPLTLAEISNSLPGARGAKRLSPSTLTRWIISGLNNRDGNCIRLKATRCGARWLVYQSDLERFFAALNPVADQSPTPRSPAERNRASQAAADELERLGA